MSVVDDVALLLRERIGLDAASIGRRSIESAVAARRTALGLPSDDGYAATLARPGELARLIEEIVVPESWFFREPATFAHLLEMARAWSASHDDRFRILCVPCARGEEPISAVIALVDGGIPPHRIDVVALDVSPRQVEAARIGKYSNRSLRGATSRHITDDGTGELVPAPEIRRAIRYGVGNVLDRELADGEPPFQAVLCRNLLIYLTGPARRRCLSNLTRRMAAGAILFTGSSEALAVRDARFQPVGPSEAFAFRQTSECTRSTDHSIAIELLPAAGEPSRVDRAAALANAGSMDEAYALLEPLLAGPRPDSAALHLAGVIQGARGRWRLAEQLFARILVVDPHHEGALRRMALIYERRGDPVRATGYRRRIPEPSTRGTT